jgi:hypothetical protein
MLRPFEEASRQASSTAFSSEPVRNQHERISSGFRFIPLVLSVSKHS